MDLTALEDKLDDLDAKILQSCLDGDAAMVRHYQSQKRECLEAIRSVLEAQTIMESGGSGH